MSISTAGSIVWTITASPGAAWTTSRLSAEAAIRPRTRLTRTPPIESLPSQISRTATGCAVAGSGAASRASVSNSFRIIGTPAPILPRRMVKVVNRLRNRGAYSRRALEIVERGRAHFPGSAEVQQQRALPGRADSGDFVERAGDD